MECDENLQLASLQALMVLLRAAIHFLTNSFVILDDGSSFV